MKVDIILYVLDYIDDFVPRGLLASISRTEVLETLI